MQEALEQAPVLAQLGAQVQQTQRMLACIRPALPPALRDAVMAGPLDDQTWCVLMRHNTAASKVRQLAPLLLERLVAAGYGVTQLRIKVTTTWP